MDRYAALPPLPERINRLDQLAGRWSWNADGRAVFRKLDYTCGVKPRTIRSDAAARVATSSKRPHAIPSSSGV
jgi:hypothetical protein